MQHENFTDESLQLEDIETRNRMDYFTDFVDDIDDVNFDNFLSKSRRQELKVIRARIKELRKGGMRLKNAIAQANKEALERKKGVREAKGISTIKGKPKSTINRKPINLGARFEKRPAKAELKEEVNQENDEIINGEVPIDAPIVDDVKGSFFEENKQMIMIGGGILLAGIVYFKFIKK